MISNQELLKNLIIKANSFYNHKYDYSKTIYKGWFSKIIIICPIHGEFLQTFANHLDKRRKTACPNCCIEQKILINKNKFIINANKLFNSEYSYSKINYINNHTNVIIICKKHGEFQTTPNFHLSKIGGCSNCKKEKNIANKVQKFLKKANKLHNNKYNYSKLIYKTSHSLITIVCPKHDEFEQTVNHHLAGSGCYECSLDQRRRTTATFIMEAIEKHGDIYDYSFVEYGKNGKEIVKINCRKHGVFEQTPNNHLKSNGHSCPKCFKEHMSYSFEEFIEKANKEHNNFYSYEYTKYNSSTKNVIINCPNHGKFKQKPAMHLSGNGCPDCGLERRKTSLVDFINQANNIHNNKYNYTKVNYINSYTKIKIQCKKHNFTFAQTPFAHLQGSGCFKCGIAFPKLENLWLNSLNIKDEYRHITIKLNNKIFKVDAYDPETNTIYEFYGDFWHGNPSIFNQKDTNVVNKKTYSELFNNTINRKNLLINAGYNFIFIWERDFKDLLK